MHVMSAVKKERRQVKKKFKCGMWGCHKRKGDKTGMTQRRSDMGKDCVIVNDIYADTAISFP